MTIRIGANPIAWANDDVGELGAKANPLHYARMGFTHLSPAVAAAATRTELRVHPFHPMKV
jgi:hypothetical protein